MKAFSIWLAAVALIFAAGSRAHAGTLATPLVIVNGTDFPTCVVTNVGTNDATVSVVFKNGGGVAQPTAGASCDPAPHTLAPGTFCFNRYAAGADGYCVVSASGKVRAALEIYDSGFLTKVVVPATK